MTHNPKNTVSGTTLTTGWSCFLVDLSSNPQLHLQNSYATGLLLPWMPEVLLLVPIQLITSCVENEIILAPREGCLLPVRIIIIVVINIIQL